MAIVWVQKCSELYPGKGLDVNRCVECDAAIAAVNTYCRMCADCWAAWLLVAGWAPGAVHAWHYAAMVAGGTAMLEPVDGAA